jgi:Fe2+ transport system protein FeoA
VQFKYVAQLHCGEDKVPLERRAVKGKDYLYYTFYDPVSRNKKRLYAGPAADPASLERARKLEQEYLRRRDEWKRLKERRTKQEAKWFERSFRELIDEQLSKNGPLHYRALTEEILKVRSTRGKTPDQTILAILERGTREPDPRYVKTAPGTYGLMHPQRSEVLNIVETMIKGKRELQLDLTRTLTEMGVKEGDEVEIIADENQITVKPVRQASK